MSRWQHIGSLPQTKNISGESYNGWTNWDTWETAMLLDNDERLNRWKNDWKKNFERKKRNGTFDMNKAEFAVRKHVIPVLRGTRKSGWNNITTDPNIDSKKVNTREIVNHILED